MYNSNGVKLCNALMKLKKDCASGIEIHFYFLLWVADECGVIRQEECSELHKENILPFEVKKLMIAFKKI